MMVPATSRQTRTFEDRADALAHFFLRAGEAPRLLAYDDAVGCPLDQALAAIEWTTAVGILAQDDLIHAARLGADAAAAVVERKRSEERRVGKECRSRWSPDHEKKKRKNERVNVRGNAQEGGSQRVR